MFETKVMTGEEFIHAYKRPFVYCWKRRDESDGTMEYLYIGCTNRGIVRLLHHHDKFAKVEQLRDTDEIEFHFPLNGESVELLESRLIVQHDPFFCDDKAMHHSRLRKRASPVWQRREQARRIREMYKRGSIHDRVIKDLKAHIVGSSVVSPKIDQPKLG